MALRTKLEVIDPKEFANIHDMSVRILNETGVIFQDQETVEIFRKNGARVEGLRVFISPAMVEEALSLCTPTYRWNARNETHSRIVGEGFLIQPNAGPVYIQDIDNGRRVGTLEDYRNIMKLCQASNVVSLVGAHPVNPSDVPDEEKHLHMMYEILAHTDKPVLGYVCGGAQAGQMLDMLAITIGGEDVLRSGHWAGVSVNPLSPLRWSTDTLGTLIEYARRNQAIFILPCIMAGVSGPISLLGTAVLQNAEILSGIVLTKLINPTAPVVSSPSSTVAYLKKASYVTGTPEGMLINLVNLQMALDYYHLPTRTMCGMTEAKTIDCQAGYETMQNLMLGMLGGAHIVLECLGVLDSIMTTSYEKFIIDEEILSRIMRICQGVEMDDLATIKKIIDDVGHEGTYLTHESTFAHFKDRWLPTVSDWESYDDWEDAGKEDIVLRANKKYKEILASAPESLINKSLSEQLKKYMQQARN